MFPVLLLDLIVLVLHVELVEEANYLWDVYSLRAGHAVPAIGSANES